eukprot:scaffold674078_cov60-Prasinocladus_malaysianus.AAC.1
MDVTSSVPALASTGLDFVSVRRLTSDGSLIPSPQYGPVDWGVSEPLSGSRLSRGNSAAVEEVDDELTTYIHNKQDILGGELVVRVLCAENLASVGQRKRLTMRKSQDTKK